MSRNDDNNAVREDDLLREYAEDTCSVTMESTLTLLFVLNTNMASMRASIKQLHAANADGETQAPTQAESANNRKSQGVALNQGNRRMQMAWSRGKDLKLSNLQATLTKVGNITARMTDMLLKAHSENTLLDIEAMIKMNSDSVALLGHVSFEIAQRRRDVIRPNLNKDYATL